MDMTETRRRRARNVTVRSIVENGVGHHIADQGVWQVREEFAGTKYTALFGMREDDGYSILNLDRADYGVTELARVRWVGCIIREQVLDIVTQLAQNVVHGKLVYIRLCGGGQLRAVL